MNTLRPDRRGVLHRHMRVARASPSRPASFAPIIRTAGRPSPGLTTASSSATIGYRTTTTRRTLSVDHSGHRQLRRRRSDGEPDRQPERAGAVQRQRHSLRQHPALPEYNALEIPKGYFPQAMERLRRSFLDEPVDAVLHPASDSAQQIAKEQKDKATIALGNEERQRSLPLAPRKSVGAVTRTKFWAHEDWKSQLRFRPRWRPATSGKLRLGRRGACGGM